MRGLLSGLPIACGVCLLGSMAFGQAAPLLQPSGFAQPAPFPVSSGFIQPTPSQPAPPPTAVAAPPAGQLSPADQELQQLFQQLTTLSEKLVREVQSPDLWYYQCQQADILLQIATRSNDKERDNYLRMAIESYHAAAVQSPDTQPIAVERLGKLPAVIRYHFPASPMPTFAALQIVRADHARTVRKNSLDPARSQAELGNRLLRFAQQHPQAPEAVPALLEAARIAEGLGNNTEACRSYRLLAETQAGKEAGRQRVALRRLGGLDGELVELKAPLLYPTSAEPDQLFDLKEVRGKVTLVYFWASDRADSATGFDALKRVTDRLQFRGLEVVCVCMDADAETAKDFLSGKLIGGTHVLLKDGLKTDLAERYGLEALPETILIDTDGKLLKRSIGLGQLETVVAGYFPASPRR